ncbi:hypothetical protein A2801_03815 [Candidatus Woesebacteria bacterium RIFCSPHIGHO2_01_FULL_41_10]|uniref:LamG-like jellyroll fold domain-containing protein n=1 Tax=Candidatus Woesebacteria bacterium RIFCSPHIGHO2_01_FULL_41_10 TaxID=1802500 RepID=A0A1F7YMI0_9BACT|nr:MAG: hypothetical protein A2801_03815 [Candidatus Woesebacteria bacterium RIFCSPHIGHO2_01_FULL_41_10]
MIANAGNADVNVDFNGSESFSICAWIYSTTMAGNGNYDAIVYKWDDTTPARAYGISLTNDDGDTTGNIEADIWGEGEDQSLVAVTPNDSILTNTWYHVCMTFNGGLTGAAEDLKLYVDGIYKDGNATNASFNGLDDVAADFTVGDFDATDVVADDTAFTGRIDEVQVFGSALTGDQIKIIYAANSAANFGVGTDEKATAYGGPGGNPPVVYWSFDENKDNSCTGGEDICDKSGSDFDGTFNGDAKFSAGKLGSAVSLDNSGDYVNVGAINRPVGTAAYTISTWLYPTSLTGGNEIYCASNSALFCWWLSGNQIFMCADGTCSNQASSSSGVLTLNQWNHAVVTYDGSSVYRHYVNGVDVTSDTSSGEQNLSGLTFYIGADVGGGSYYGGKIDELKIYDYVLSNEQIQYEYNGGAVAHWWKFDECTGGTAYDNAKNANGAAAGANGTITIADAGSTYTTTGTCASGTGTEAWNAGTTGKRNASIGLDGTNDYVDAGSDRVDSNADFSFAAWVYANTGTSDVIMDERSVSFAGARMDIGYNGTGIPEFGVSDGTDQAIVSGTGSILNGWHHLVGTWDESATTAYLYVDGQLVDTDTNGLVGDSEVADQFGIGVISGGAGGGLGTTGYFDGRIDDVQIYNYLLTEDQVLKIMNNNAAYRWGTTEGSP